MQKKFIKVASIIIALAMVVTLLIVFCFQSLLTYQDGRERLNYLMDDIERHLMENEEQIAQLKQTTNEDYLARTRAFAYMIQEDPTILESEQELKKIMTLLDVDELHVIDENGIIRWGTVSDYFGFDMSGSEQTVPFMELLDRKSVV